MKARTLVRLYPAAWRRRYAEELEELLGSQPLTPSLAIDLVRAALAAHTASRASTALARSRGGSRMRPSMLRQPSALIPLAMSLCAFVVVIAHLATTGVAREADEGNAAHLWQLLMAGQLPVIGFFAIRWLPRRPRQALLVLVLQAAGGIAAAAPVVILRL
jgi:hypothetical protein